MIYIALFIFKEKSQELKVYRPRYNWFHLFEFNDVFVYNQKIFILT